MAKKIKKVYKKSILKLLKLWGSVLTFILGIFGVNNFLHAQPDPPIVEYGVPYAVYKVHGTVTPKDNDKGIPGIKVSVQKDSRIISEVLTDENGEYIIKIKTPGALDISVKLICEDIDGDLNGSYKDIEKKIKIKKKDFIDNNKDKMDEGVGEKLFDVKMQPE